MTGSTTRALNAFLRNRAQRQKIAIANFACVLVVGALLASSAASQTPKPTFDHDLTRFVLTGRHQNVTCESCHQGGQFEGTTTSCNTCHGGGGASPKRVPLPATFQFRRPAATVTPLVSGSRLEWITAVSGMIVPAATTGRRLRASRPAI